MILSQSLKFIFLLTTLKDTHPLLKTFLRMWLCKSLPVHAKPLLLQETKSLLPLSGTDLHPEKASPQSTLKRHLTQAMMILQDVKPGGQDTGMVCSGHPHGQLEGLPQQREKILARSLMDLSVGLASSAGDVAATSRSVEEIMHLALGRIPPMSGGPALLLRVQGHFVASSGVCEV